MDLAYFARKNMEKAQLLTCDLQDPAVLSAIDAVDRAQFVPEHFAQSAYVDEELPLCSQRYLMEPLVFARLMAAADIAPDDKVLDIGCCLGYSAAVIAKLARKVVALESQSELVNQARKRLSDVRNIEVVTSPLVAGFPGQAPYDVIFIEGAVQHVPQVLLDQLADGGRLVTVESCSIRPGARSGLGHVLSITRLGDQFYRRSGHDVSVPLLAEFEQRQEFRF